MGKIIVKTFVLPGMGADSRMYSHPAYKTLQNVKFIDWPSYRNEKTISQIARRVIVENNISKNQNIGGSSLGGIVASEIAKLINVNSLFLIGSSQTPKNVNIMLRKLSNFSHYAPINLIQYLAGKAPFRQENNVLEMLKDTDKSFIKNMSKAIFKWEGNFKPNCNVYSIHGRYDKIIIPTKENTILLDGGHLIAITHANEVAGFLCKHTCTN